MEDILYDYHIGQAMAKADQSDGQTDFKKTKYFLSVLQKHGITQAEFDSSMVYYYSNLVRLKGIYTEVNERLADEANELGAAVGEINRYSQYKSTGDTASIWKGASDLLLIPRPGMNRYDFTIKADTTFHVGDTYMFQFTAEYIWQTGMKDVVVCFASKYEGDSIIQTVNHVSVSGLSQIRIPGHMEKRLKEMHGYIYVSKGDGTKADARRMMFISQIQFIRFHQKKTENDAVPETSQSTGPASSVEIKQNDRQEIKKTDSLQRGDKPRRPVYDTARIRVLQRLRHQMSSPSSRGSKH